MKLLIRASILSLAVAGLVAGFAPNHSAQAQAQALSHQVVSGIVPMIPVCSDAKTECNMRTGVVPQN
jgi:hypothetical protein